MTTEKRVESLYFDVGKDYEATIKAPFRDSLTGLYNHGFFFEVVKREIKQARRTGSLFCLAMLDVDGFDLYNRTYGTVCGDRALKEIAAVIQDAVRASDLCARYLGDQFILLLHDIDIHHAEPVIDRIEANIRDRFQEEITVGIGCVSLIDTQDADDAVDKAKQALLSAKLQGRGKHCLSTSVPEKTDQERYRVLVVDDEPANVKFLEAALKPFEYDVLKADNGEKAVQTVARTQIDLVLLDAMMPIMDGFEACRRLKTSGASRMIPVIMITALDDRDSKVKAIESGADDFITKPPDRIELVARIKALLKTKRLNDSLIGIENVLFSLANTIEAKDTYTQGHVKRVSNLAVDLGRLMGLSERELEALRIGGMLHDIGKIGIPDAVLNKPGRLDEEEWRLMKAHPEVGYRMAEPLRPILKGALDVIHHHHERLNGSGYPDGISGEDISIVARVMAVADVYDALVTDRPYRRGMTRDEAVSIIKREADGGLLDDTVVAGIVSLLEDSGLG